MERTRLHFDYKNMHLSIKPLDGSFLELYSTYDYDNIIKNVMHKLEKPFNIFIADNNNVKMLYPVPSNEVIKNNEYKPKISKTDIEDGMLVKVEYKFLWDGENAIKAEVFYTALLKLNSIEFKINIKNLFEGNITKVRFPIIPGVILGNNYENNSLVLPRCAGLIIDNPVKELSSELKYVDWSWQEYKSSLIIGGNREESLGMKGLNLSYPCGGLSMSWLEMQNNDKGMYLGIHDALNKKCTFEIATEGENFPGIALATLFQPRVCKNEIYESPSCVINLHKGDWHSGAKIYRKFKEPLIEKCDNITPKWLTEGVALYAHYDFMYQNKVIVHKYCDIKNLVDDAVKSKINHLLFAGWNYDGFDEGYPLYILNPELGTDEEFKSGIEYANKNNVHISLYMNISLMNTKYFKDELKERAIMQEDGTTIFDRWGNHDVEFAKACPNSYSWQNYLSNCINNLVSKYGIEGIYFDMLSTVGQFCFSKKHNHPFDYATHGILNILKQTRDNFEKIKSEPINLMGEWVTDLYGNMVNYQLQQSWMNCTRNVNPSIYRYTFPKHGIVDMIYPAKNLAMRSSYVSANFEKLTSEIFTNGSYFWIYDLEEDNTFKRDKESFEIVKNLMELSKLQKTEFKDYIFVDTDDINYNKTNAKIKRFELDKVNSILLCYRFNSEKTKINLNFNVTNAIVYFSNGKSKNLTIKNNCINLPKEKYCLIKLS